MTHKILVPFGFRPALFSSLVARQFKTGPHGWRTVLESTQCGHLSRHRLFSPFITLACNNSAGGHYLLGNFDYATSNCLSESVPLCPVSYQIAPSAQNSWTYNATTKMLFTNSELSSNGSAMCLTSATYQLHTPCAKNPSDACETFATTCSGIGTLPITLTPVAE